MLYNKYQPHVLLQKYIDCYWVLQTDSGHLEVPLYADANTDLFINIGINKSHSNSYIPGVLYLRGPATFSHFCNCSADNVYMGIRFKPGGLPLFYQIPVSHLVDRTHEIHDMQLKLILNDDEGLTTRLDHYFLTKKKEAFCATNLRDAVYRNKGQLSVDQLAKMCNLSNRTLERHCYLNMGIGPKEFINIVRFKYVVQALESQKTKVFGKVAVGMGYYDQSHFIKEIKKRTGLVPSSIFPIPQFP